MSVVLHSTRIFFFEVFFEVLYKSRWRIASWNLIVGFLILSKRVIIVFFHRSKGGIVSEVIGVHRKTHMK